MHEGNEHSILFIRSRSYSIIDGNPLVSKVNKHLAMEKTKLKTRRTLQQKQTYNVGSFFLDQEQLYNGCVYTLSKWL